MTSSEARRLIVGISGASGVIYGIRALELLRGAGIETHLVMSKSAEMTLAYESDLKPKDVKALASVAHSVADVGASISSGSFPTMGMLIAPCSIRTMSEIATGVTSSLLTRAADPENPSMPCVPLPATSMRSAFSGPATATSRHSGSPAGPFSDGCRYSKTVAPAPRAASINLPRASA